MKQEGKAIDVQGRLRMSDKLEETRVFFIDVTGRPPIRMELGFGDFHRHNVAYHVGTAITIKAEGQGSGDTLVIRKIKELKSVLGKQPGDAPGQDLLSAVSGISFWRDSQFLPRGKIIRGPCHHLF